MGGFVDLGMTTFQNAIDQASEARTDAINKDELKQTIATAEIGAVGALARGESDVARLRARGNSYASAAKVALASGNIDASSGSAAAAQEASSIWTELDVTTARANARNEALGFKQASKRAQTGIDQIQFDREQRALGRVVTAAGKTVSLIGSGFGGGAGGAGGFGGMK